MLSNTQIAKAKALRLSPNFTLFELIKSDSFPQLVEWPDESVLAHLEYFAQNILQPIRDKFGRVVINSGYRNASLNSAVGGVGNSIHKIIHNGGFIGVAADIRLLDEPDIIKAYAFIAKLPAAKRVIMYRDLAALRISRPFIHVDTDVKITDNAPKILLEKINNASYVNFDKTQLNKYSFES